MANHKTLYYLDPSVYYYNYELESSVRVSVGFTHGIYCRAYSLKQALIYFMRRIAIHDMVRFHDIHIEIDDISTILENYENEIPQGN